MKKYKKIIFDMDYTIVIPDWSREDYYFKAIIPVDEQEEFFSKKQSIINNYTLEHDRYDISSLSESFRNNGFNLSEEVITGWLEYNGKTINDTVVDGVTDLFDYLKENNISIVVLTNGFSKTHLPRLERAGLSQYIDYVITGERAMKPALKAFELAMGDTPREDCLVVGDNDKSDILGAINAGIDYYKVDEEHTIIDLLNMMRDSNKKANQLIKQ